MYQWGGHVPQLRQQLHHHCQPVAMKPQQLAQQLAQLVALYPELALSPLAACPPLWPEERQLGHWQHQEPLYLYQSEKVSLFICDNLALSSFPGAALFLFLVLDLTLRTCMPITVLDNG